MNNYKVQSQRNKPDWSTLPEHLLPEIAKCFHSVDDILRFRAACKSFRSSVSSPLKTLIPHSARRTSFPMGPTPSRRCGYFLLTESTVYAIEPLDQISNANETTQTWLVKIEELNSGEVRIKDPLNGFRFRKLSNKLPKCLNWLDYRVKEITKAYRLELGTIGQGTSRLYNNKIYQKPTIFVKVVVSTSVDEFAVMAIHRTRELFVWRDGDDKLTRMDIAPNDFKDIIYHNKKFYALADTGLTITVDAKFFNTTKVAAIYKDRADGRHYLVKSLEDLFLVVEGWEYEPFRLTLKVFKLDEERNEWVHVVDGLEDTVFFVGDDCSFCLSAKEFSGCKGNCIYFSQNSFCKGNDDHPGMNAWIFNLKDNTFGRLSAFQGYSKIFWPLPTWLKHHASPVHRCPPPH